MNQIMQICNSDELLDLIRESQNIESSIGNLKLTSNENEHYLIEEKPNNTLSILAQLEMITPDINFNHLKEDDLIATGNATTIRNKDESININTVGDIDIDDYLAGKIIENNLFKVISGTDYIRSHRLVIEENGFIYLPFSLSDLGSFFHPKGIKFGTIKAHTNRETSLRIFIL